MFTARVCSRTNVVHQRANMVVRSRYARKPIPPASRGSGGNMWCGKASSLVQLMHEFMAQPGCDECAL